MPVPYEYLELGLIALGRGGQISWFNGHFGAALLAAYYMDREHDLPGLVCDGLTRTCEKYRTDHPEWFVPFKHETSDPALLQHVLDGLALNLQSLRTSGHGLALGVLGLKALLDRPDLCTPSIVDGLCKTLVNTSTDRPQRYYSIENYQTLTEEDLGVQAIPAYETWQDLICRSFDELDVVIPNQQIGDRRYLFTGEAEHGVTHGHALYDLHRLGYPDLAQMGWKNHRIQMFLNRQIPDDVLVHEIKEPTTASIFDASYWEKTFNDPHALKVPYASLALLKTLPEDKQAQAERNVCKLLDQMA